MMMIDEHTPCPACAHQVRDLYAVGRRVLEELAQRPARPEYAELLHALETMRPFVEAHHANQVHAFAAELETARTPTLEAAA